MRLTHPSASIIASQLVEQQPVDRTCTASDEEACKPDRCRGAVEAATSTPITHTTGSHAQAMVSIGPHCSIRCTSPVQRSPRHHQQQQQPLLRKRQAGQSACPYHDHETMTISLVGQANLYGCPARAVLPQRSHRNASPSQGRSREDADRSRANDGYVRLVSVIPAVGRQHGKVQFADRSGATEQQEAAAPVRCPEPAAAAAAASNSTRRAALAQLRMARRRQQQLLPAEIEQHISEKMCGRKKQGCGADWSSRRMQDTRQLFLGDSGDDDSGLRTLSLQLPNHAALHIALLLCSLPALTCCMYCSTMQAVTHAFIT